MTTTVNNEIRRPWRESHRSDHVLVETKEAAKDESKNSIEKKLKHSEFRLKQAQAIAHIGSWELDLTNGIAEWSEEACRIYGLDPKNNLHTYEDWLSFVHPDDVDYAVKMNEEGRKELKGISFEHRIIRPDGTIRYIFSKAKFELNELGKPEYLHGISHDITKTKLSEQALIQSEANLKLIIDLMPQYVFAKDTNGKFVFVNKNLSALYGLTPKEMLNKSIADLIPVKKQADAILKEDRKVIVTGRKVVIPQQIFTDSNGNDRLFHNTKVQYIDAATNEKMVLGIAEDITEQRRAETERSKMLTEIIMRNKCLENFSYIVSHNLRAPVANIMGLTDVLQIPSLNSVEKDDLTAKLQICSGKLNEVVIDLNNILQVDRKENRIKEKIKLSEIVTDVELGFGGLIRKEGIKIKSDFSEINKVFTIKDYVYSIFFNLISNSIKFRRHDISSVIHITSAMQDGYLQIVFKDNGLGIDLEKRSKEVFGLYKRFHLNIDGKGMGLFMVKTQVESLGGNISVLSEVNKGTEFRIEIPIS